jgi:hypothetical protein
MGSAGVERALRGLAKEFAAVLDGLGTAERRAAERRFGQLVKEERAVTRDICRPVCERIAARMDGIPGLTF